MYELMLRPDSFKAAQDGAARVVSRGDLVMGSFDVIRRTQLAARVTIADGPMIEIDEEIDVPAIGGLGIRYLSGITEIDTIGTSQVRLVAPGTGLTRLLAIQGPGPWPQPGDLVHLGEAATESLPLRVRGIEAGEGAISIIVLVAAAPEIDALVDAEFPPRPGRPRRRDHQPGRYRSRRPPLCSGGIRRHT